MVNRLSIQKSRSLNKILICRVCFPELQEWGYVSWIMRRNDRWDSLVDCKLFCCCKTLLFVCSYWLESVVNWIIQANDLEIWIKLNHTAKISKRSFKFDKWSVFLSLMNSRGRKRTLLTFSVWINLTLLKVQCI